MSAALYGAAALLVGAASLFARREWLRAGAYCLLLVSLAGVWIASLGHPRPVELGFSAPSGTVIAFSLDEPHAIYVWLMGPGAREPIAFELPWRMQDAVALAKAADAAKQSGASLRMRGGSDRGVHEAGRTQPMFYPAPPPPLPAKTKR